MMLNVQVSGPLSEFVAQNVGEDGAYADAGDYVGDLIRRDLARVDDERFEALKVELQSAFAAPDSDFRSSTAEEAIARNAGRRVG
jgi:antitoxin ParD1/3/4